jgi:hypothetical protein
MLDEARREGLDRVLEEQRNAALLRETPPEGRA